MCLGPLASAVIKGNETSVWARPSNSRLAFSAASLKRCMASLSPERSIPLSFWKSLRRCSSSCSSKSSPPSMVSPFVAFTSNTPPWISSTETSKVPPPKRHEIGEHRRLNCQQSTGNPLTKIEHYNRLAVGFIQAISERSSGRFVDDTKNVKPGDLTSVFCGLTLTVIEVGRDGHDRLGHSSTKKSLGSFLHLTQDH
mmetsp:Transcript_20749/g.48136  ORF Transcript_20749/g.48136 Transcript_20749/m.48136 type:complete len:197 (-) Transcript_20749:556-1146(-)